MTENDSAAEKRIAVDYLTFGAKIAKRVAWEAWEFAIEAPHLIRVTNASYGFKKDDHSYLVGLEDQGGIPIPAECECPADKYNEDYSCKHRVALATVGGPLVLQAATDYPTPGIDTGETTAQTLEEKLRADGGAVLRRPPKNPQASMKRLPPSATVLLFPVTFRVLTVTLRGERNSPNRPAF